ncbi:hypothetical protein ACFELO_00130 [Oceanicaulis sp. LC35]|uniref:hypothetical protein n=1 Tax=Oceanicaulis sp. LC35 TaxID=3349635 RepID=UPI003F84E49F
MAVLTRRASLAFALVLSLGLAACGPDAPDTAGSEHRHNRPVTEAQAQPALAAFGLDEQGRASWSERRFERGGYVFSDFEMMLESGRMRASELVLTGPQMLDDAPFFTGLMLETLAIEAPDGALHAATLSLSEPSPELARAIAGVLRGDADLDELSALEDGYGFAALELVAPVMQIEDAPDLTVTLSADNVRLTDFTQGDRLGAVEFANYAMEGVDEQGQPMAMSVAYLEAAGLRLGDLEGGSPFGAALMAPGQAPYELIDLRGLELEAGGVFITLPELNARVEALETVVMSSSLTLPELRIAPATSHPQSPRIRQSFDLLGYDEIVLSAAGETRYDPAADRAWTEGETYLRLEDGLTLTFDQEMTGLAASAALAGQDGGDPARTLAPLMIHHLQIELADQSLMGRITEQMAKQSGLSETQARDQLGAMARMGLAFAGTQMPAGILQQAAGAIDDFIASGGVLRIEMRPDAPVSAAALAEYPAPDAATLGLTVTHEPGEDETGGE